MSKYIVYSLLGVDAMPDRKPEPVAVEYGNSISEAARALVKAVTAEIAAIPEYKGYKTVAYAPKENCRYQNRYMMQGVIFPPKDAENILIDFMVEEEIIRPNDYLFV